MLVDKISICNLSNVRNNLVVFVYMCNNYILIVKSIVFFKKD